MENLVILASINLIILMPFLLMKTTESALHFQSINLIQQNNSVKQDLYVTKGVGLKINCSYSLTEGSSLKVNWSEIFWQWNKRRFKNHKSISQCLSILHIEKVWWLGKQTFFCVYKGYTSNKIELIENKTLVIISGERPKYVPRPSIQWIEDVVEITWKPNKDNDTMSGINYTVEYFVSSRNIQNIKTILGFCGNFLLNDCSNRKIYHCITSFRPFLGKTYNVKLVAENKFGKTSGETAKVVIPLFQQKMMLKPVKDVRVYLTKSGAVRMRWTDAPYYGKMEIKKVKYNCEGSTIINFTRSDTFEISKDKLPAFTYCTFCVSRRRYLEGQFSCDECKVLRTAEDIPTGVPKLKLCEHNACPSTYFGTYRNVTISWTLPHRQSWNGKINRLLIFYYERKKRMLQNITIRRANVSELTLNKLQIDRMYYVYMVMCTNAGCSGKSNVIHIPGFLKSSVSSELPFFSDKANTGLVVGLTLAILGMCFVFIFVLLFVKRREVEILPPLQEPQATSEQEPSQPSPSQEVEYDLLEWRNSTKL